MTEVRLTMSWDDGHPADLRLAEHLQRHGIAATFYVPLANCEDRPVLGGTGLRRLVDAGFEIAGHTLDHRRLPGLPPAELQRQIADGRARLADLTGRDIAGFAYPGGRTNRRVRAAVAAAGFRYARTVEMLRDDAGTDPFALPTTVQFYPHRPPALLRNWLRHGGGAARLAMGLDWMRAGDFEAALAACSERVARRRGLLHVWGHSWEIEALSLWPALDRFLGRLAALVPAASRLDNRDAAA